MMEPKRTRERFPDVSFFIPTRRFDPQVLEMMDRPNADPEILRDDLDNLRTINKYFGGLSAIRKNILPLFNKIPSDREIEILDLATGSADQPLALVRLAQQLKRRVRITAIDRNLLTLEVARERTKDVASIIIGERDILSTGYTRKSFDIVLCSLAIHHFSNKDVVRILKEMDRLSRVGFIVNDLNRSWLGAGTAWLYTHLTTRNPMTLFDSHYSVLRSFRAEELKKIAEEAGIQKFTVKTQPMFRLILVASNHLRECSTSSAKNLEFCESAAGSFARE